VTLFCPRVLCIQVNPQHRDVFSVRLHLHRWKLSLNFDQTSCLWATLKVIRWILFWSVPVNYRPLYFIRNTYWNSQNFRKSDHFTNFRTRYKRPRMSETDDVNSSSWNLRCQMAQAFSTSMSRWLVFLTGFANRALVSWVKRYKKIDS
jgi:hypothetical protein